MAKKVVLKLDLHDEKGKQKAMMTVSSLPGIDSIAMDMKDKKLTVTGEVDPVSLVAKLRKVCNTDIVTFGPAKEPEKKKEEPKKAGGDQRKIDDVGGGGGKHQHQVYYQNPTPQPYQFYRGAEDDPNYCVIS